MKYTPVRECEKKPGELPKIPQGVLLKTMENPEFHNRPKKKKN